MNSEYAEICLLLTNAEASCVPENISSSCLRLGEVVFPTMVYRANDTDAVRPKAIDADKKAFPV